MNKVCLFGASGHGKVVREIAMSINTLIVAILDDTPKSNFLHNTPIVSSEKLPNYADNLFVISIGNNKIRKKVAERLQNSFTKLIHKESIISPTVSILEGSVVMAGVKINVDTIVGKHVIVNTGSIIEHDCSLANFVHVSPNATLTGNVHVGEGTHIGAGAIIIPNIKIGKWAVIGAGSIIIEDVPDYAVVVGSPGKIIKYTNK